MKLTRTRLLPILLLVLFVVAMVSSCMMLISCKDEEDPYYYKGEFYTLQEAYDNGYLTYDDLKEIEKAQKRELKDEKLKRSIMNTYVNDLKKETDSHGALLYPDTTMNDVSIYGYYGTYNDSVVVKMYAKYFVMFGEELMCVIGDIVIKYTPPQYKVWRRIK